MNRLKQNILAKMTILLLAGAVSVAILPTPFLEWVLSKLFDYAADQNQTSNFWPPFSFYVFLFSGLVIGFYSHHLQRQKTPPLIEEVTKSGSFKINNSKVYCYLGSIENISDIDVVVTSENTNLDLGGISGTSVSGRIRKMAASFNDKHELEKDYLNDFINDWKKDNGLGPFNKGQCIISPPFNAKKAGIKSIVHAVAIEKNGGMPANMDDSATRNIVQYSITHTIEKNYKSIFIPVFGLGSGRVDRQRAIDATVGTIKAILDRTDENLKVYIGVYRADDSFALIKQLTKKTI